MHLTHELILSIQIKRGKVHLNGDSTVKSPCWHQVLNLWPSDPDLFQFAVVPSLQDLAIYMVGLLVIRVLWVQVNLDPVILFYWDQRSMWTLKSPQNAALLRVPSFSCRLEEKSQRQFFISTAVKVATYFLPNWKTFRSCSSTTSSCVPLKSLLSSCLTPPGHKNMLLFFSNSLWRNFSWWVRISCDWPRLDRRYNNILSSMQVILFLTYS